MIEHSAIIDIAVNAACFAVGWFVAHQLRYRAGKSDLLSAAVGLLTVLAVWIITARCFHINFYLNVIHGPESWERGGRFFIFAIPLAVYSIYRVVKERRRAPRNEPPKIR
jgi:hypothetical protein